MTLSWSETRTVPVNEQQFAYCAMNLSIFAALSAVSAAHADGICHRTVKTRTRKINFFTLVLTSRGGLDCRGSRDCTCIEPSFKGARTREDRIRCSQRKPHSILFWGQVDDKRGYLTSLIVSA